MLEYPEAKDEREASGGIYYIPSLGRNFYSPQCACGEYLELFCVRYFRVETTWGLSVFKRFLVCGVSKRRLATVADRGWSNVFATLCEGGVGVKLILRVGTAPGSPQLQKKIYFTCRQSMNCAYRR